MKNYLLLLSLGCATPLAYAQQPAPAAAALQQSAGYQSQLMATIEELQTASTTALIQQSIDKLERAATAAPTDWLPRYYQAYGYIRLNFLLKDEATRDKYLDQAQGFLDQARRLAGSPSELLVLQSFLYQARLAVAPMQRAMEYGPKISAVLKEAQRADPQNPRASYLMGSNLLYKPAAMGGGSEAARPWLEQAITLYNASQPTNAAAPHWGRAEASQLLARIAK